MFDIKTKIFIWDYYILLSGSIKQTDIHRHNAVQVFISVDTPVSYLIDQQKVSARILVLNKNVNHLIRSSQGNIVTLLIDGDSKTATHINTSILKGQKFISLEKLSYSLNEIENKSDANEMLSEILNNISELDECVCEPKDSRIKKAIEIIDNVFEKKISIDALADKLFLSPGRLTHLFKEQMGIPLRRYLLWRKLRDALALIMSGKNMTFAAYESGFADSAHLSRTFKQTYGLNLSEIFKNSQFIQLNLMNK